MRSPRHWPWSRSEQAPHHCRLDRDLRLHHVRSVLRGGAVYLDALPGSLRGTECGSGDPGSGYGANATDRQGEMSRLEENYQAIKSTIWKRLMEFHPDTSQLPIETANRMTRRLGEQLKRLNELYNYIRSRLP